MIINTKINGEHIKNARLFRGLSLSDLSERTNITKQALSLYENGSIRPEINKLLEIADALQFPVDFFMCNDVFSVKTESTYFRSLMSTSKIARTSQCVRVEFIAKLYEVLIDYVDFPDRDFPSVTFQGKKSCEIEEEETETLEIERIASQCRKYWGLGYEPIKDLQKLIESKGIIVTSLDTKESDIDAFSQRTIIDSNSVYIIVLNSSKNNVRSRFDLAHELGHILLHPWSENIEELSKQEFKDRESQANKFAGAFLLPKETFGNDVGHYPTKLDYYIHLKNKWKVSIQAMVYRAHQLGIISNSQYQYLMRQISKRGWRTNEPNDTPYIMSKTLLQEAIELLFTSGKMTPSSFMSTLKKKGLNLRHEDIEDLLVLERDSLKENSSSTRLIKLK
ncbi:MAG: XRE family transcriptional regulator [Eubacterium sp.]|nr:XRE family transcriptional regulator [Eubacterium sp.]